MNLRISNLSSRQSLKIAATCSANGFDGADVSTVTDATLALIPDKHSRIEGTLKLAPNDIQVTLATDASGENVIVSTDNQLQICVPIWQNIAIECDQRATMICAY